MKNYLRCLVVAIAAATPSLGLAQTVLANWTFETSIPVVTGAASGSYAAEGGVNATSSFASGLHTSASTAYSSPAGNGSAHSFSSNNWSVGNYYQFTTSTIGFSNIKVVWDQFGSGTGPLNFDLQYSIDGTNFTSAVNGTGPGTSAGSGYTVLSTPSWSSSTAQTAETYTFDLSSITTLNEAATVTFRLVDTSTTSINNGTVATTGTGRVDNFTITSVPEPSTYAAIFGGVALAGAFWQRHRSRKIATA